jgi:hypothetical protein
VAPDGSGILSFQYARPNLTAQHYAFETIMIKEFGNFLQAQSIAVHQKVILTRHFRTAFVS